MATRKKYDLAVVVDSYPDPQDSSKRKNKYLNIGCVMERDDGGEFILLDRTFNPAGVPNPDNRSTIIVSKFEIKDRNQQQSGSASNPVRHNNPPSADNFDDTDVPF
jgi:hypothetical protein